MVDALREALRVLAPPGVLIDVRPIPAPMLVEIIVATQPVWATTIHSYAQQEMAAAEAAVAHAVSSQWVVRETSVLLPLDIYCDTAAGLNAYVVDRKLRDAEIPYDELEQRRRDFEAAGKAARLRCRRAWKLNTYRKNPPPYELRSAAP